MTLCAFSFLARFVRFCREVPSRSLSRYVPKQSQNIEAKLPRRNPRRLIVASPGRECTVRRPSRLPMNAMRAEEKILLHECVDLAGTEWTERRRYLLSNALLRRYLLLPACPAETRGSISKGEVRKIRAGAMTTIEDRSKLSAAASMRLHPMPIVDFDSIKLTPSQALTCHRTKRGSNLVAETVTVL
jgi:hypothetical protein